MKVDRLETHDRLLEFKKKGMDIAECCQDIIDKRPFGEVPFYIFAHARTDDDGVTKRLIWQPRLTRPKAQTNSMLFRVAPPSDNVEIIWIIPQRELWKQFDEGKMMQNDIILKSIRDFMHNREDLERPAPDDLTDVQIDAIYMNIAMGNPKRPPGLIL
jgi:hypothetical protein